MSTGGLQEVSSKLVRPVRSVSPRWIFRLRGLRRTYLKDWCELHVEGVRSTKGSFTTLSIPRSTELSSLRGLLVVEAQLVMQTRSWWFTLAYKQSLVLSVIQLDGEKVRKNLKDGIGIYHT